MEKWFNVGKVVNTHGVRGEIRVISRTDFPEERYKVGNSIYFFQNEQVTTPLELKVKTHRVHKNFNLLTFDQYDNVNDIEFMKGGLLKVPESFLGELQENEYYFHEIIGCKVITVEGDELGVITEILTPGANDVWVAKGKGGKELLIPYIEDVVMKVDVKEKIVVIELMEGLF
ncbi:ribosome maturation factor RimM [Bacillus sp. B1-b2]|uniref:ribosome maturation factor RimM n=1 Tax=Bacillus sp. B1-b2 TaxID=2653201 RepID=UPI00126140C8|nr:ribosome maturation factor RimM [Bacillus sp. B1-b2]KAB7668618.1 ribosome maturation factor RimM [Bacillus sp. B1-b2]